MGQALKAYGIQVYGCDLMQDRIDLANKRGIIAFNSLDSDKSHELIYKYKYFDGFGSLLGYTKVYLDNILNDITNFGSSFVEFTNKNRKNLP